MKKNDLIKLLQGVPGNPEVVLWNGMVGDYMHIDPQLVEGDLVKQTFSDYSKRIVNEEKRIRRDWEYELSPEEAEALKGSYRKYVKWEVNQYVTLEDIKEKRYTSKRVFYINAKSRGETMHDRLGNIHY